MDFLLELILPLLELLSPWTPVPPTGENGEERRNNHYFVSFCHDIVSKGPSVSAEGPFLPAFGYVRACPGKHAGPPLRSVGGGETDGAFHASLAAERGAASVPCFRFVTVCFRFVGNFPVKAGKLGTEIFRKKEVIPW